VLGGHPKDNFGFALTPSAVAPWMPASAGMTPVDGVSRPTNVIPAEAGI
jgi:hypothetical protein